MSRALVLVRAEREDRLGGLVYLGTLVSWLAYTNVFWQLHAAHVPTLPRCPFLALTGHPCPLCGGTRAFAAMWRGDVATAVHYHPLGPLLFVGALAATGIVAALLVTGRGVRIRMEVEKRAYVTGFAVLVLAWAVRLAFLPLPASP